MDPVKKSIPNVVTEGGSLSLRPGGKPERPKSRALAVRGTKGGTLVIEGTV